jgi:hypothetical protein
MDWDDWNVWGGDLDIGCNNCFNNINGKINLKDVDWSKVDRSKLNFDRDQLASIDKTKIRDGLKGDRANSIRAKAGTVRGERAGNLAAKRQVGDIRKGAARPKDAAGKGGKDLAAARAGKGKVGGGADAKRPNAGKANVKKPSGAKRPSGKAKPGARVDRRPQPSALGNVDRGRASKVNSNRGRQSMGGGARGGPRHVSRSGYRPPVARSGGRRGGASFHGGGGRRMHGGGGGGRRGGGGGGRRR